MANHFSKKYDSAVYSGKKVENSSTTKFYSSSTSGFSCSRTGSSVCTVTTSFSAFYSTSYASTPLVYSSSSSSLSSSSPSLKSRHSFKVQKEDHQNELPSHLIEASRQKNKPKIKEKQGEEGKNMNKNGYRALENTCEEQDAEIQREDERLKKKEKKDKKKLSWCVRMWRYIKKEKKKKTEEQTEKLNNALKPISDFPTSCEGRATCREDLMDQGYKIFHVMWRCTACTFFNHSLLPKCEGCGTVRAPGTTEWVEAKRGKKG